MRATSLALFALAAVSSVFAHPIHHSRELRIVGRDQSVKYSRRAESTANATVSGFEVLSTGNQKFRENIAKDDPTLLQTLADEEQDIKSSRANA